MKLKKIASLMLAGIMAVSMLAGCKTATEPTEEPEVTPVTGAAAAVNAELDKLDGMIEFTNDSVVEKYLTDYYAAHPIKAADANKLGMDVSASKVGVNAAPVTTLVSLTGAAYGNIQTSGTANVGLTANNDKKTTALNVFVLNAKKLTKDSALKLVGQYIDTIKLPEEGTGAQAEKNYSYTGSVAAIEAKSEGGTASAWVIAVTVTQTPSAK